MRIVIEVLEISAGAFRARCPALPGCVAVGRSAEDVQSRMAEAVRSYLVSFDVADPERLELEAAAACVPRAWSAEPVQEERRAG